MDVRVLGHARLDVDPGIRVPGIPRHALQVGARAEVAAGSGHDDAADVVVGGGLAIGVVHPDQHGPGQGVVARGPVHGDGHDVTIALDECVRHQKSIASSEIAPGPISRNIPHTTARLIVYSAPGGSFVMR